MNGAWKNVTAAQVMRRGVTIRRFGPFWLVKQGADRGHFSRSLTDVLQYVGELCAPRGAR